MPIKELYHNWLQQICELRPNQRSAQVRNFVWLMIGIYRSRSVYLSEYAEKIPGSVKLMSMTQPSVSGSGIGRLRSNGCKPSGVVGKRSV
jgi:hypothetical protein